MSDIRRILIIGNNTRHIACSAKRAGYTVHVIDRFGDVDIRRCVDGVIGFDHLSDSELNEHIRIFEVDAVVLGSGFETRDVNLSEKILLGNDPAVANRVSDKEWLAKELNKLGIPHPRIYTNGDIEYPAIIKPKQGSGGHLCRIIHEGSIPPDYIAQECLVGNFASVSVLSTREGVVSLAVNEQLIGVPWLGATSPFRYCGNITPFNNEHGDEMRQIAEEIILHLGLIGSNGVDFIITKDGPVVLEVNPRFQGSLDTVELATGINLFDAHVQAISGVLERNVKARCFAAKMVVFATDDMIVRTSLEIDGIVDIPRVGEKICVGGPIATALGTGIDRKSALYAAMKKALMIKVQTPGISSGHEQV